MVEHTSRRTDDDLGASLQVFELTSIAGSAIKSGDADARAVPGASAQLLADLDRQLAGWGQYERLCVPQRLVDAFDQRDAKRRCLAGTRLRLADHVAAVEQQRNHARLNLCRADVMHLAYRATNLRGEHELGEAAPGGGTARFRSGLR